MIDPAAIAAAGTHVEVVPGSHEPPRLPFRRALEHLINRECMENGSNTPDFILAAYLGDSLAAFDKAVARREEWYGRDPRRGPGSTGEVAP